MEWVIKKDSIKSNIDDLLMEWASDNGIGLLKKRLMNNNRIGYTDIVTDLDTSAQVNFMKIGGILDTIDDYYGALGYATLKVAVRGYKDPSTNSFITEKLGFYIKDSYDFVDENEFLGVWGKNGVLTKVETVLYKSLYAQRKWLTLYISGYSGYIPIYNKDFRSWQDKHNEGVDFIVFSDVLWLDPLPQHRVIKL